MTDNEHEPQDADVSFADVAAEDPDDSVAHEAEATEAVAAPEGDAESANDSPPTTPTISSIMGGGPVHDGDQLAP